MTGFVMNVSFSFGAGISDYLLTMTSYLLLRSERQSDCLAIIPMWIKFSKPLLFRTSSLIVVRFAHGFRRYYLLNTIAGLDRLPKCNFPFPFRSLKLARFVLSIISSFLKEGKFYVVFLSSWRLLMLFVLTLDVRFLDYVVMGLILQY
jgi:hypothetical protein